MFNNPALIVIVFSFVVGVIARLMKRLPENAHLAFNGFVIYLALPALILTQVPNFFRDHELSIRYILPAFMPWIGFPLAYVFCRAASRIFKLTRESRIVMTMALGLGNTSFVGFPLLESLIGPDAIPYGVLIDQLGTFLVFATLGLSFITWHREHPPDHPEGLVQHRRSKDLKMLMKRMFSFPPFLALLASFVLIRYPFPETLQPAIERIGQCLVPVALMSVGLQKRFEIAAYKRWWKELVIGLSLKLVVWPIIFGVAYYFVLDRYSMEYRTVVLESAMAPMITSMLLTMEAGFAPELAGLFLTVGIPLSFLTTWICHLMLPHPS